MGTQDASESSDDRTNQESQPPQEQKEQDQQVSVVSFFTNEEEQELDEVFNIQHSHNTKSKWKSSQEPPPSTPVPNKGQNIPQKDTIILKLTYNLGEYLKRVRANISLFYLLNIPSIIYSLPKSMIIKQPRETQNKNLESYAKLNNQNLGSKGIPPFFLTFDIFNRNVHNCMIDSGTSSNVMSLPVCKKLNATW